MATLSEYLIDTRRVLRDSQAQYWSDSELTSYINRAMRKRDTDSGQNVLIQSITLVEDQNEYTFNAGDFDPNTVAVFGIIVTIGNVNTPLGQRSYAEASSYWQPTTTYKGYPMVFAYLGATKVFIAPAPNLNYESEWETAIVSTPLATASDADPLPAPWTEPIPYLAAHYARYSLQQYDEAKQMKQEYDDLMTEIAGGVRGQFIRNPYPGSRSRA